MTLTTAELVEIGEYKAFLKAEVRRLRRILRRINDDCRAVVGDTNTVNDRVCGMCEMLRHIRSVTAEFMVPRSGRKP